MEHYTKSKEYKKFSKVESGNKSDPKKLKKLIKLSYKNINYRFSFVNSLEYAFATDTLLHCSDTSEDLIISRYIEIIESHENEELTKNALDSLIHLLAEITIKTKELKPEETHLKALDVITDNLNAKNPNLAALIWSIKFHFVRPEHHLILNNYNRIREIVAAFSEFALNLDNGNKRNSAVGFLLNLGHPDAKDTFKKLLSDDDIYVKANAKQGLELLQAKESANKNVADNAGVGSIDWNAGTQILEFPGSHINQYNNHIKFIRELKKKDLFPALKIFKFETGDSSIEHKYLLVITGDMFEAKKYQKLYLLPEVEEVFYEMFGKGDQNWSLISPPIATGNVPMEGYSLDLTIYNDIINKIQNKYRLVEEN